MESSTAEFLKRQFAFEQLPTNVQPWVCHCISSRLQYARTRNVTSKPHVYRRTFVRREGRSVRVPRSNIHQARKPHTFLTWHAHDLLTAVVWDTNVNTWFGGSL